AEIDLAATPAAVAGRSAISVTATGGGFSTTRALPVDVFVPDAGSPRITSFAASDIFVGERARLTAVFSGDAASIDGIGAVQSGVAVQTPPLSRTTTFTLRVTRGDHQIKAQAIVQANYRNRIRLLRSAPVAQTGHLAAA